MTERIRKILRKIAITKSILESAMPKPSNFTLEEFHDDCFPRDYTLMFQNRQSVQYLLTAGLK